MGSLKSLKKTRKSIERALSAEGLRLAYGAPPVSLSSLFAPDMTPEPDSTSTLSGKGRIGLLQLAAFKSITV
mgnify:CR=1 FL=1